MHKDVWYDTTSRMSQLLKLSQRQRRFVGLCSKIVIINSGVDDFQESA